MYRVIKALNHNAVLALESGTNAEYLIMGKGIGFGKRGREKGFLVASRFQHILKKC